MPKIKLPLVPAPAPHDPPIVADSREKVADSREKVARPKGKTSEAQLRANQKWQEKQSRMTFRMPPELRTHLDAHAAARGESTTAFIIRAIKEQMERDSRQAI